MQATANLWDVLCRDYESERRSVQEDESCEIAKKFLASARQVLRNDSGRLADALEIVGDVHSAAGQESAAVEYFEEALDKASKLPSQSAFARLAAKLALHFDRLGRGDDALHRGEVALAAFDKLKDYSHHALLLNHLGSLCRRHGHFDQSIKYYRQALQMAVDSHGGSHPDAATAMNNLGVALTEMHDFVQAESVHMEALGLREKSFGPMHPEVAQSMVNLGAVYHWTGQHAKARGFYEGALQIYQSFNAPEDIEVVTARENLEALNNLAAQ